MKNWSLSKKIWSVFGILSLAFIVSTGFSLKELMNGRDNLTEVTKVLVRRDQLTSEIKDNQRRVQLYTLETILQTDGEDQKIVQKKYDDSIDDQEKDLVEYKSIADVAGKGILEKYLVEYRAYMEEASKARALGVLNKDAEATAIILSKNTQMHRDAMGKLLVEMNKLTEKSLHDATIESNENANHAIWVNSLISGISIFVSLMIAFFVLRSLTLSISRVVSSLFDSSAQVSAAATQIASSSEELSQATTEQAASLEETAASIEEMNSMVGKNSENANSTAATSGKSQEKASHGKAVVERMIESMDAINASNTNIMDQVNRSNESMAGIVKVIEEIGNKTKVINDIVFQTKLLSFNASVEAARAGEHGKGFAVVAEEVGNLAQMSGNAAKEISTLLEDSIQKVNQIVLDTKSSVEKLIVEGKETVDGGTLVARECGEVLEEIVRDVSSVSSMAVEIASASQEQARGVTEITKAMSQLDQMTQQNAATSEECASSAEELSAQSISLKNAVNDLVMTINGADGQDHQPYALAPVPVVRKKPEVKAAAPTGNVVHMKHGKNAQPGVPLKRAVGEAPAYNGAGFEEV